VLVVVVAIVFGILGNTINKIVYSRGQGNILTSIIVSTAMNYINVASFFYIPKNHSFELNQFDIYEKIMQVAPIIS
jgi:hypothetical protein